MANEDTSFGTSDRAPKQGSKAFDCPRCGAYAHQAWESMWAEMSGSFQRFRDSTTAPSDWSFSQCALCGEKTVWRESRIIYPPSSATVPIPHNQMPPMALELYQEAREVIGISRRAGTALARASLESALRDLDPVEGNPILAVRIEHVLPRVSGSLTEMLTVIRHAGNESLHVDDAPLDDVMLLVLDPQEEEIVEFIFESLNLLVEELVAKPARTSEIFAKVPAGVRAKIEAAQQARVEKEST